MPKHSGKAKSGGAKAQAGFASRKSDAGFVKQAVNTTGKKTGSMSDRLIDRGGDVDNSSYWLAMARNRGT